MNLKKKVSLLFALGLSTVAVAQNCESSYYTRIGAKIETTEYDKSGAIKSVTVNKVTDVKNNDGIHSNFQSVKTEAEGTVGEDRIWHFNCNGEGIVLGLGS